MSNGSREFLSVEEIRERIRNRVREITDSTVSAQCGTPGSLAKESPSLAPHQFNKLRLNLQNANSALTELGAINPRPAGWTNEILQVLKKGIRRALSWLLRPIQQFDSAVMVSLNETTHILAELQTELRFVAGRVEAIEGSMNTRHPASIGQIQSGLNGAGSELDIDTRLELLQSQLEALAKNIEDLRRKGTVRS